MFNHDEKLRRIQKTKDLLNQKYSLEQISKHMGLKIETVQSYVVELDKGLETKKLKKPESPLFNFAKPISSDKYLEDFKPNKKGRICPLCKKYYKYELLVNYSQSTKICKLCYRNLKPEQIEKLK